jgi:hypothetical protein
MKKRLLSISVLLLAMIALLLTNATPDRWARGDDEDEGSDSEQRKVREWDEFAVFIEICGTDLDAGLKILLGGEPWKQAAVFAPDGRPIYQLGPRLGDVGSGTVFLESAEPPFADFPLDEFLDRFPEGEYTARGTTLEGIELKGTAVLTHNLPAGPTITSHKDGEFVELTGKNLVVTWEKVTEDFRGGPLGSKIVAYILTVTYEMKIFGKTVNRELTIDVIPPDTFSAEIPADFLKPNTEVQIEVAAREESGNRTSKEIFINVVDSR